MGFVRARDLENASPFWIVVVDLKISFSMTAKVSIPTKIPGSCSKSIAVRVMIAQVFHHVVGFKKKKKKKKKKYCVKISLTL